MRLIDADRLKAHYCWWSGGTKEMTIDEAKKTFDTIIDVQPTVDAVPTEFHDKCMQIEIEKRFELELKEKHGHWIGKPIDAVEVVRCKDCIRYVPFKDVDGVCLAHNTGVLIIMSQNGYCNLGERREDDETN